MSDEHLIRLPGHGSCYICGDTNPRGLGLVWYARYHDAPPASGERLGPGAVQIISEFQLGLSEQGPPGHVHGGASAAILDEAMGAAVWRSGLKVVLANLDLNYRAPVPLGVVLRVEAEVSQVEGRKARAIGRILLPDGRVGVEGSGLYVHAPQLFGEGIDYFG